MTKAAFEYQMMYFNALITWNGGLFLGPSVMFMGGGEKTPCSMM